MSAEAELGRAAAHERRSLPMPSFPDSDALRLWLGLALVFAIEALVVARLLAKIWAVRADVAITRPRG